MSDMDNARGFIRTLVLQHHCVGVAGLFTRRQVTLVQHVLSTCLRNMPVKCERASVNPLVSPADEGGAIGEATFRRSKNDLDRPEVCGGQALAYTKTSADRLCID